MLPTVHGEFGIVADPEIKFSEKGNAWMRVRCVAKDRVRDSNGTWSDGKTLFIDVWVSGKQSEHLADSVGKGDNILVTGKLEQNEWTDKDGVKRTSFRILADNIGPSVRFRPAKTESVRMDPVARVSAEFDAQPVEPPF